MIKNLATSVITLILTLAVSTAYAAVPSLTVMHTSLTAGSVTIVPIHFYTPTDTNAQPTTVKFTIHYHANLLSAGDPMDGETLTNVDPDHNILVLTHTNIARISANGDQGIIEVIITPKKGNVPISGGEILQVPFTAAANSPGPVTVDTDITISDVVMSNGDAITPGTITSNTVTISWPDTDSDGVPDNLDEFPNNGGETVDTDNDGIGDNTDGDDDNDGIPDTIDPKPLDPSNATADTDGDGLTDYKEFQIGTLPSDSDTDNDGMPDGWEYQHGLKPLDAADAAQDPDVDGLTNLEEYQHNTDPHNPDTDGDGVNDGDEVAAGTDPNVNIPAIMTIIQQLILSD
jgi:hypothetical protein